MPLSDELQNLKDGIKAALDTSVEDGIDQLESEEIIENLSTNFANAMESYYLSAQVETDDVVLPPTLMTTTAGPNIAPVFGVSIGEIVEADYDFLKLNIKSSYTKIQLNSSPEADYKEVNRVLGGDLAISIYAYALSASILSDSELESFATVGVPPGVTPATMPAGEVGQGTGQNTVKIIDAINERDAINQLELSMDTYQRLISLYTTDEFIPKKFIVQPSEDNQIRIIAVISDEDILSDINISDDISSNNQFVEKINVDQEDDLGVTGLGSFVPTLAQQIKDAYNKAVEDSSSTYQEINEQLGKDIGQAIHDFIASATIKTAIIYQGGLGEDPPAGSSGATITASGSPAAPVTAPGAPGAGIGALL